MTKSQLTHALSLCATLVLAACSTLSNPPITERASNTQTRPSTSTASTTSTSSATGAIPAAVSADRQLIPVNWEDLPNWQNDDFLATWPAFRQSCRGLASKQPWRRVCSMMSQIDPNQPNAIRYFFEDNFRPYAIVATDGKATGLITGYYEPLLRGTRTQTRATPYKVLGVPDDLLTIELGDVYPELKNMRLRGRLQGNKVVPYAQRAEIESGKAATSSKPIVWVDDPIELFFLQVQGSGRVRLPDGSLVRLGYADQNGYPYQSIGKVLIERGELRPDEASMQGIQNWARNNPQRVQELLNRNPSYVFFREMAPSSQGDGPQGALGVPLTPSRSIAVDPRSVPLGAPVFLDTTYPNNPQPMRRLMFAQDTGGAIKGAVRADFFWGFGPDAGEQAGRMKQSGRMWVLLPQELAPK